MALLTPKSVEKPFLILQYFYQIMVCIVAGLWVRSSVFLFSCNSKSGVLGEARIEPVWGAELLKGLGASENSWCTFTVLDWRGYSAEEILPGLVGKNI